VVDLSDDPRGGLADDPIQSLRPASVGPRDARICSVDARNRWLVARICSVDARNRWLDAPIRWLDAPIRPDCCHCSNPTRLNHA
jgi:hypothetical protein